jgi:hypothetical protein
VVSDAKEPTAALRKYRLPVEAMERREGESITTAD